VDFANLSQLLFLSVFKENCDAKVKFPRKSAFFHSNRYATVCLQKETIKKCRGFIHRNTKYPWGLTAEYPYTPKHF